MKTLRNTDDSNNTQVEKYINANQIDWRFVNKLGYDNFELLEENPSH